MSTKLQPGLLDDLATFVRVVDADGFSAAGRQLGLTPSAVSRSITRLEQSLSTRLLERTTRKLRLSAAGAAVLQPSRDMLQAAQTAMDLAGQRTTNPEGLVRLSVPKAVGRFVIHPHIPAFLQRYPKVDVQLLLDDRPVDPLDGAVDLAIRITDQPPPGLKGRPLLRIEHLLCATPRYLADHGSPTQPADLAQHSCIRLGETPEDARWNFRRNGKTTRITVHGRYAVNHTGARLDAVLQHVGIGSLPWFTARQALQSGEIVQVLPEWEFVTGYSGDAWLLYPPTRHLPARLRVFIDFLVERLQAESGSSH